jgi:nucleoside triphosphate diphosphatase
MSAGSTKTDAASSDQPPSVFDGLDETLGGFDRAIALQDRAATVGFDWPVIENVLGKLHEELGELEEGIAAGDADNIAEELGDLLFAISNLARKLGLDPVASLEASGDKFVRRFCRMEASARAEGVRLQDESLPQLLHRYERSRRETGLK